MTTASPTPTTDRSHGAPTHATRYALAVDGDSPRELLAEPQTIGGGPRCSLRLDGPGLRPLHCVVTVTDSGPKARRWADGTLLNGEPFSEAELTLGDVLSVGTVDLRLVELPAEPSESPLEPATIDEVGSGPEGWLSVEAADPPGEIESSFLDSSSSALELPSEETPPAADPPEAESVEWFDDSVEAVRESFHESTDPLAEDDVDEVDPAVPQRLLQKWNAEGATDPSARRDTAEAIVPMASEWAVEPEASESEPEVETPADPDADGAGGEWNEWTVEPQAETPQATDSVAFEPEEESHEVGPPAPTADVASLRERLATRRLLVGNLVTTLRGERLDRQADRDLLTERESQLAELRQSLEELAAAFEAAQAEASQVSVLAERLAAAEGDLVVARSEATEAATRVEQLEAQISDLETDRPSVGWHIDESAVPPEVESASSEQAEPVEDAADVDLPEPAREAEEPSGSDETLGAADAEETTEIGPAVAPAADLWGIERLADPQSAEPDDAVLAGNEHDPEPHAHGPEPTPHDEPPTDDSVAAEHGETAPAPEAAADEPEEEHPIEPALVEPPVADATPSNEPLADVTEPDTAPIPIGAFEPREQPAEEAGSSESFIERYAHMLPDDDEPVEAVAAPAPAPIAATPEPTRFEDDADDSIDDYMQKLMQRMRGESGVAAPAAPTPVAAPEPAVAVAPAPTVAEEPAEEALAPIRDLSELKSSAPSEAPSTDIGALRQLANQSARHALDVAETREGREQATVRLIASVAALGGGALACITSPSIFDAQFLGGAVGVAAGSYFGLKTLRACQDTPLPETNP